MAKITSYIAHDPISNTEGVVAEYDRELLLRASESGIVFIAVDEQGERSIVSVDEVKEPEPAGGELQIVQPMYVDERMMAVVEVFDALAAQPAKASERGFSSTGAGPFLSALNKLKTLVCSADQHGVKGAGDANNA